MGEALKIESNIISPKTMTIEKNNSASRSLLIKFYQMCLLAFFYILFIASKPLLTKWIRRCDGWPLLLSGLPLLFLFHNLLSTLLAVIILFARAIFCFDLIVLSLLLSVVFFVSRGLTRKFWCFTAAFSSIIQFFWDIQDISKNIIISYSRSGLIIRPQFTYTYTWIVRLLGFDLLILTSRYRIIPKFRLL